MRLLLRLLIRLRVWFDPSESDGSDFFFKLKFSRKTAPLGNAITQQKGRT